MRAASRPPSASDGGALFHWHCPSPPLLTFSSRSPRLSPPLSLASSLAPKHGPHSDQAGGSSCPKLKVWTNASCPQIEGLDQRTAEISTPIVRQAIVSARQLGSGSCPSRASGGSVRFHWKRPLHPGQKHLVKGNCSQQPRRLLLCTVGTTRGTRRGACGREIVPGRSNHHHHHHHHHQQEVAIRGRWASAPGRSNPARRAPTAPWLPHRPGHPPSTRAPPPAAPPPPAAQRGRRPPALPPNTPESGFCGLGVLVRAG